MTYFEKKREMGYEGEQLCSSASLKCLKKDMCEGNNGSAKEAEAEATLLSERERERERGKVDQASRK